MFTLNWQISLSNINRIKELLRKWLPDVSSGHLTEAIAHSFGCNSQAAILVALRIEPEQHRLCDGKSFRDFLIVRNHQVGGDKFYLAVAYLIIEDLLEENFRVGAHGYGFGEYKKNVNGQWETDEEHYNRFQLNRKTLVSETSALRFLKALTFLQQIQTTKNINTKYNSYNLKHIAEKMNGNFPTGELLDDNYVSNSELILAVLHLKLRFKASVDSQGYYIPNINFNLSQRSIVELDRQIRPELARA